MGTFGIAGTPGIVWRDKQGKIQVKSGMPRLSELAGMTGLPAQKEDDPELAKFK
jgi:thiol:disulfide interchange protein DsbG